MAPIPRELLQLPSGHTLADRVKADLAFRAKFRATVAAMGSVATEVDGLPGPPWHRRCVLSHLRAAGQALVDWHDDLRAETSAEDTALRIRIRIRLTIRMKPRLRLT